MSPTSPSAFVVAVLIGWIPVVLVIFSMLPPRRAATVAFVVAWLFLPVAAFKIPGIPVYDKMTATCVGILLAAVIFDLRQMTCLSFCPHLIDLPMIVYCLCPLATAWANDPELTTKDGLQWTMANCISWGLPYLIGRIYFANARALRDLTVAILLGGLVYVPLCLWEIRMSPQLHRFVYGYNQHSVAQQARGRFFRPMVFMEHGLALALFMVAASLAGLWLWRTGAIKKVWKFDVKWLLIPLWGTTILCQSGGATACLAVGAACLYLCKWMRSSLVYLLIMVLPMVYLTARIAYGWDGQDLVKMAEQVSGADRAQSLGFRVLNERAIMEKAKQRLGFGWGGYGRPFILDEYGNCIFTPDSLWIITFGTYGLTGLAALYALVLPIAVLHARLSAALWSHPAMVGVCVFSVLLVLYSIDNLMNNMPNPLFLLGLGGLSGMAAAAGVSMIDADSRATSARRKRRAAQSFGLPPLHSFPGTAH
jgi:hypothetical protein